jgi:hypothetical protein
MVRNAHEFPESSSTASKDASPLYLKSVWSKGSYPTPRAINIGMCPLPEAKSDPKSWRAKNPNSYLH